MTVEYRKLVDWNPRTGDVFENENGGICRAVSDTRAGFDEWGGRSEPFEWFGLDYRLVSRASDQHTTPRASVSPELQQGHAAMLERLTELGEPITPDYFGAVPDTPKTWGEMTDEEQGAILLADHRGEMVEWLAYDDADRGYWLPFYIDDLRDDVIVRVRPPEPKRETVTIYGAPSKHIQWCLEQCGLDTHRITLPLLDGNIPAGTYTSEAGETIIVEEL